MKRFAAMLMLGGSLAGWAACNKSAASDEDSIRATILQHLRENSSINLAAMETTIQQVSVNGDQAQAQVLFRTKQEGATMQMTYALERSAGAWKVLKGQPAGGQVSHPPMDGQHPLPADQANQATPANPQLHWPSDKPVKQPPAQANSATP